MKSFWVFRRISWWIYQCYQWSLSLVSLDFGLEGMFATNARGVLGAQEHFKR
jgi:hypothetical protein